MTEDEYINLANRVRVSEALGILRNVMPVDRDGVTEPVYLKFKQAMGMLFEVEDVLFTLIQTDEV